MTVGLIKDNKGFEFKIKDSLSPHIFETLVDLILPVKTPAEQRKLTLWCLKRLYEGLKGTTKKFEKNLS